MDYETGRCKKCLERVKNQLRTRQAEVAANAPKVVPSQILRWDFMRGAGRDDTIIIPSQEIGIKVMMDATDTWLIFETEAGQSVTISVGNLLISDMLPSITAQIIEEWTRDRRKQADAQED